MAKGKRYVAYYRVSTSKQGASGLGLEAQRVTVRNCLGPSELIGEYTEVESGRRNDRPQLKAAIQHARLYQAALVVAKVDRLARSVSFLSTLIESGIETRFADLPNIEGPTGRFILQQMASVAELEAGLIGARTKAALAAAKARGRRLGGYRGIPLTDAARASGREIQTRRSMERARQLKPMLNNLFKQGVVTYSAIARALTSQKVPTSRGHHRWTASQVARLFACLRGNQGHPSNGLHSLARPQDSL